MRAIVGYSGFVGSNLLQFYKFDSFYNSKNFHEASGMEFDELFFCGVPAVKWYANKYPKEDTATIETIQSILKTIKIKKLILISTIDVYENTNSDVNEDYTCSAINHTYGSNRYLFEQFVKAHFEDHHIIRLPALFGKGLKKNIIYDLIHNNQIENISPHTFFQWYDLDWLKEDIETVITNNRKLCNLFTEPLATLDIIKLFDYPMDGFTNKSNLIYNLKTKYGTDGYSRDKESVLHHIKKFLAYQKIDKTKLVVSNICVKNISQFQFSCILKLYGIQNVQVAPTTLINSWDNLSTMKLDLFQQNGIKVYSLQSIAYGLNELNIFENSEPLLIHLKKVIDYSILHGIKVLVFGCPKNRRIVGTDNDETFCTFFRKLSDYIGEHDLMICIEQNSKKYGCNYINTIKEAGTIVTKINSKNIKMMVDIGNAIMEEDTIEDMVLFKDIIYNIDISNESMAPFLEKTHRHIKFIEILKDMNYTRNINLEMIIPEQELDVLCKSLNNFIFL